MGFSWRSVVCGRIIASEWHVEGGRLCEELGWFWSFSFVVFLGYGELTGLDLFHWNIVGMRVRTTPTRAGQCWVMPDVYANSSTG